MLAATVAGDGLRLGLLATAFGFGFRHGIDWDHIAALTDITSSQETSRRSMLFATLYALGHALVVFILGVLAIVAAEQLPAGIDGVMERFVGVTLLALGIYVFYGLARHGRNFRMRSRWMLIFAATRRTARWLRARASAPPSVEVDHDHEHPVTEQHIDQGAHLLVGTAGSAAVGAASTSSTHRHHHRHISSLPDDPFLNYGRATSFGVGMIHGVGAETPTQLLIFVTAAGAGGKATGVLLLLCFLAGLLSSNTSIALASTFGFLGASRHFRIYLMVSVLTATFSLIIGGLFVAGRSTMLPAIFGG
jgi:cytochrome c biogenesis protein CcdA